MYNSKDMILDEDLTFLSFNQTINEEFTVSELLGSGLWITDYNPLFEDIGVTGNNNNKWVNQSNAFNIVTDETGTTLTESRAGNYTPSSVADSTNWNDHLTFDMEVYVEFDVVNVNRAMFRVYYDSFSTQFTFVLETGHYKFFIDNGIIKYWIDGVEQSPIINSDIKNHLIFSFVASNEGVTSVLKYKNFRVYMNNVVKAVPLFNCDKIVSSNSFDRVLDDNKCIILENNSDTFVTVESDDTGGIHYYNSVLYAYAPYCQLNGLNELVVYCIVYDKYLNTLNNVEVSVYVDDELNTIVKTNNEGLCEFKVDTDCTVKFKYEDTTSNEITITR